MSKSPLFRPVVFRYTMTKITLISLVVFLTLAVHFDGVLTAGSDEFGVADKRRDGEKKYSPLWFGPRIGRRKRNPSDNIYKALDRDEIEAAFAGPLKNPWPVVAINNGESINILETLFYSPLNSVCHTE